MNQLKDGEKVWVCACGWIVSDIQYRMSRYEYSCPECRNSWGTFSSRTNCKNPHINRGLYNKDPRTEEQRQQDRQWIREINTDGDDREAITDAAVAFVKTLNKRKEACRGSQEQNLIDMVNLYNSRPWRKGDK